MKHQIQIWINLLIVGLCLAAQTAMPQVWTPLSSGMNGEVKSLDIDTSSELYAGGIFTHAGGISATNVAKWNGASWTNLGGGWSIVNVLALSRGPTGALYAAGNGERVYCGKWNGSTWTYLDGVNGDIYALTTDMDGNLYAGGNFNHAGNHDEISAECIAKWNGSAWTNLGSGMSKFIVSPSVRALIVNWPYDKLYAGGEFDHAGSVGAENIAKWNGTSWTNLGNGLGEIYTLAVGPNGDVYASGENAYINKWNGTTWTNLGGTHNGYVYALAISTNNEVYAGGDFTAIGGVNANFIAKWDGSRWTSLGSGMNDIVYALAVDPMNGDLYAGGAFTSAGGVSANCVAKWSPPVIMNILGTNGAIIANSETASAVKGTDFGERAVGTQITNTFSITNGGSVAVRINGVTTNGTGSACFIVSGIPGSIGAGGVSNFSVKFNPTAFGLHTAILAVANNSTNTPYLINFRGASGGEIGLSSTSLIFTGTYGGTDPTESTLAITNLNQAGFNFTNMVSYGSGVSGWLSVSPAIGSVSGNGGQLVTARVTIASMNAGVYTATNAVTASNAWNSPQYLAATLTINKADQSITNFPNPGDQLITNTVWLLAQTSSGLPVNFFVGSGFAQITSGTNLSFTGTGRVSIVASQAGNSNWNAAPSVTNSFTVTDIPPLPAPQNLSATDGQYTDKIRVAWNAVSAATGYQVWRGESDQAAEVRGQGGRSQIGQTTGTNYNDTGAKGGQVYYYWVKATNAVGASAFSASDSGWLSIVRSLPADFDGDGKADPAVYLNGNWYIWLSSQSYAQFGPFPYGYATGIPVPADYDGDNKADPAVVLGTDWVIWMSNQGYQEAGPFTFGQADWTPLAADFDGDQRADPARYGATNGQWYVWPSSQTYGQRGPFSFGAAGYLPVAADFDGDGKADPAVHDPVGYWHLWMSGSDYAYAGPFLFGASGYTPAAGDYDQDGKADPAVTANGIWYVWMSSQGYARTGPYQFVP